MKHNITITIFLLSFFVLSQVLGLFLISKDAQLQTATVGNETVVNVVHNDTSMGPRPETEGFSSFIYLIIGVAIGTIIVLLLIKFRQPRVWKAWFFLAVWIALSISLGVLIKQKIFFDYDIAILIALVLAIWKVWWPNILVHNITEVLMYAGIALLLVPIFDVFWIIMLLLVISAYDFYAVWKSKHMVKMAKFQTKSRVFAGLMIPYRHGKGKTEIITRTVRSSDSSAKTAKSSSKASKSGSSHAGLHDTKTAILGGGDVVFPLIFSGVIFETLLAEGMTKSAAFIQASIITVTTTIALALLFIYAKKGKFYPAMPFITLGCLAGWLIVWLL